ncbi:deleted in lung and esophageal cancer protein 1 [Chanos chanos]|uniref:Deleted in lung and esophageal cancer protein 1 n=1 Tax=Chanos chanos TaxID=29144 RepID=A0A6J2USH1_CHACN|nr:deleted in lung and esophageal cancer protein 1 [Chanos chanos]
MLNESEAATQSCFDLSVNRHRSTSEKSQDISHVLANIFKDLYTTEVIGKDTVANLTKSHRGENTYHDKYVEALKQVHSEYGRRMRDADMLENHIIQARLQAAATEDHARSRLLEEVGETYHHLALPPVTSAFLWCVDNRLLKRHNLICPQDYMTETVPHVNTPKGKTTPGFAQPTVSYNKHVCKMPQDDGYTLVTPLEQNAECRLQGSEVTLTLSSSQESDAMRFMPTKPSEVRGPRWMGEPSAEQRAEEKRAVQRLRERHDFLRNPRFLPPNAQRGGQSLIIPGKRQETGARDRRKGPVQESGPEAPVPVFLASPPVVFFTSYRAGQVYETTVELRNMTASSRHIRLIPPSTPYFSIGLGRFPGEGGIVAPGMSCQYTVRFAPDSLADYEDFIVVETQSPYPLVVPLEGHRPPPILTLPAVLDCGYCLVGGVKFIEFLCQNEGLSSGTFCIMPKRHWPASSLRSVVKSSFAEQAPFAISPSLFELHPGQATVMEVVFFPTADEFCSQDFTIVCDNCQVKDITIQGTGQLVAIELVSVSGGEDDPEFGELCDITADHFVRFESANPFSVLQKKVIIKNNAHLELPFHWQVMKPNLQALLPGEDPDPARIQHHVATDDAFSIKPSTGLLAPLEEYEFLLSYYPQELTDYHSVCQLVILDVPDLPRVCSESKQLDQVPRVSDVIVTEIECKGSTEPFRILLEPYAILIPGQVLINTTIRRDFKMWNHSKSVIRFEWERITDCYIVEVAPPTGEIEVNECFDMELVVTGGRPGQFTSTLQCHVQHNPTAIGLPIDINFKGPELTVNVAGLDLGLLRLGDEVCSTLEITNNTQLEAHWSLQELSREQSANLGQLKVEPCGGLLQPLTSCGVTVLFSALRCQHFDSVLELSVQNGTGCHLSVQADVQSPQVCLLSCELVLCDLFVGVPHKTSVTLFNQTLLPSYCTWTTLRGSQAHLCSVSFCPSSATLGPNARLEVTVSFTAHTDEELTEVAALCEVEGMNKPLVLGFFSKARRLSVSYSLPNADHSNTDGFNQRPMTLDFSEEDTVLLGKSVTRQLAITNHTAIPAPFTVEAEYFTPFTHVRSPKASQPRGLHAVQAKRVEEKAYEEFLSSVLSSGKGAAFLALPGSGTLGPFETQIVDVTAFTNMWGDYQDHLICKVGDLEPTLIPVKMSVRGCPLYFLMTGPPQPENQNQGPVLRFGAHVSGGDTVSRSVRLHNTSPYDIRVDWVTFNRDSEDRKLIDLIVTFGEPFPLKDADGNEILGGAGSSLMFLPTWGPSHTPSSENSSSSLRTQSVSDIEEEEQMEEAPARKLLAVSIRPHEGAASDYPYCITPQQIVVPAGGNSTVHVSFTPLVLSGPTSDLWCLGFALGFMSLDAEGAAGIPGKVERAQGYELRPLRMDLQASVKPPVLTVMLEEDEEALEFNAKASDLLQGDQHKETVVSRWLQLKNSTEMSMSFRLSTEPPFSVPQPPQRSRTASSGTRSGDSPLTLLQPRHCMQVKVSFHCSLSLLAYLRQASSELPPTVTLLTAETGERRLCIQQKLTIRYSNNSVQTVPLRAIVALPMLHLTCNRVDFGVCYVGQTQVKEVFLYNQGGSSSHWTAALDPEDGSDAFRITPDRGTLKPLGFPVSSSRQPLEISFTASDQREFRASVTVRGILGESSLTLQVRGEGSLDEKYIRPTVDT